MFSESCSQAPSSSGSVQRLAVLPAEALTGDPGADWVKLALPLVLQEDLAVSRGVVPFFAKDESGAYEGHATEVLRATVESRDSTNYIEAVITDPQTQQNRQAPPRESPAGSVESADQ